MTAGVDWQAFSADPRRREVAGIRASDADRQIGLDALREAYGDGRLDRLEFDRRVAATLNVGLLGEFVELLCDLDPPVPATRAVREKALRRFDRESRDARRGFVGVSVTTVGIWAATSIVSGELLFFWPIFPIVGVGIGWLMHRLNRERHVEDHERSIGRSAEDEELDER